MVGGASPAFWAASRAAAAIDSSATASMRASIAAPSRWTASVPKQVPRASALASRARASVSTRSKGAGIRSLRSSPLALTVFSSNAQRQGALLPAARANPVMLITAIA